MLVLGLFGRIWIATLTENADSQTLTWGAAYLAVDPTEDPWLATAANSLEDSIPLNGTRAMSLATGPVPVVTGAIGLRLADTLGMIDLPAYEDLSARDMPHSVSVAHRLTYLVPELLIVAVLAALMARRPQRDKLVLGAMWSTSPLVVFTFGQGMPDAWSVLVVLSGWLALERALHAPNGALKTRLYSAAVIASTIGALWTKLLPVVLLAPIALAVREDLALGAKDRKRIVGIALGALALGAVPFLLSKPMFVSVFVRFEFDMLEKSTAIGLVSAVPQAGLTLIVIAGALVWAFGLRSLPVAQRCEGLLVASILSGVLLSGIISHLLVWTLPALFLVARRSLPKGLLLHGSIAALTLLHLLWYDWLDGLILDVADPRLAHGSPWPAIERIVPMVNQVASLISALTLIAAGIAIASYTRPVPAPSDLTPSGSSAAELVAGARSRVSLSTLRRRSLVGCALVPLATVGTLTLAATAGAESGHVVSNISHEFWNANSTEGNSVGTVESGLLLLPRGEAWTSAPILASGPASRVSLEVDKTTQFSTDLINVALVDKANRPVVAASMPVWEAEPKSERRPVVLTFNERVADVAGLRVRVSRIADGEGPADAELLLNALTTRSVSSTGASGPPLWAADVQLLDAQPGAAFVSVVTAALTPWRLLLAAGIAVLTAALAVSIARRRGDGWPDLEKIPALTTSKSDSSQPGSSQPGSSQSDSPQSDRAAADIDTATLLAQIPEIHAVEGDTSDARKKLLKKRQRTVDSSTGLSSAAAPNETETLT